MKERKPKKIARYIVNGVDEETPANIVLQRFYWDLWKLFGKTEYDWRQLVLKYVSNPDYVGNTDATFEERANRLANALTGGSTKGEYSDFTWKRFVEGLVLLDVDVLTITMKTKRGNFGKENIISAVTLPKEDHLKTLRGEDCDNHNESASKTLSNYFLDTGKTADVLMKHILLKLLWKTIHAYRINNQTWYRLLSAYVNNSNNCPQTSSRRNDKRHNLQQAARCIHKISWKRFLETLKMLDVREFTCCMNFKLVDGNIYEKEFTVKLSEYQFWSNKDDD